MAVQTRLIFLLSLPVLFTAGFPGPLDIAENNDPIYFKISGNVNQLFDRMLPTIRDFIVNSGHDPTRAKDITIKLEEKLHLGTVYLTNGWLAGISIMDRAKDVIVSYDDQILSLDVTLKFDHLKLDYAYLYKAQFVSQSGNMKINLKNMKMRTVFGLDLKNYKLILLKNEIVQLDPEIVVEGGLLDPVINAIMKFATKILRHEITDGVEKIFSESMEKLVENLSKKIPSPNGNTSDYVLPPVNDFVLSTE